MKTCSECKRGKMVEKSASTPEGISYTYFKCTTCNEEILNLKQLHTVAEHYRALKRYHVKLSKWGLSLGLRIPKELAQKYNFKDNKEVNLIPEENGIKIIST